MTQYVDNTGVLGSHTHSSDQPRTPPSAAPHLSCSPQAAVLHAKVSPCGTKAYYVISCVPKDNTTLFTAGLDLAAQLSGLSLSNNVILGAIAEEAAPLH